MLPSYDATQNDSQRMRLCPYQHHKGERLVPESNFVSDDGLRFFFAQCRTCKNSLKHGIDDGSGNNKSADAGKAETSKSPSIEIRPQLLECSGKSHKGDRWAPKSEFVSDQGRILKTCSVCRARGKKSKEISKAKATPQEPEDSDERVSTPTVDSQPQMQQCPGSPGGVHWAPESDFMSSTGQVFKYCAECRSLAQSRKEELREEKMAEAPAGMRLCFNSRHTGDKWLPESEFMCNTGQFSPSCQSCRTIACAEHKKWQEEQKTASLTNPTGEPGMQRCSHRRHPGTRWLPEANFRSKTGKRLLSLCQGCRAKNHRDQNAYRAKTRAKLAENVATVDIMRVADEDAHSGMRHCSDSNHTGDPWLPESEFIGRNGEATSFCKPCRTNWAKKRALDRAVATDEAVTQQNLHPGMKRCTNRDHIGVPWVPEAEFKSSGKLYRFCQDCRDRWYEMSFRMLKRKIAEMPVSEAGT